MKTIAITRFEGSPWIEFKERDSEVNREDFRETGLTVHSIVFEDGRRWDALNGFCGQLDVEKVKAEMLPAGTTVAQARDEDAKWRMNRNMVHSRIIGGN